MAIGDLNGDGQPDLAVADDGLRHGVGAAGRRHRRLRPADRFRTAGAAVWVAIGDLNGDGHLDLAVANYASRPCRCCLGDGTGGFGPHTDFADRHPPRSVAIAT